MRPLLRPMPILAHLAKTPSSKQFQNSDPSETWLQRNANLQHAYARLCLRCLRILCRHHTHRHHGHTRINRSNGQLLTSGASIWPRPGRSIGVPLAMIAPISGVGPHVGHLPGQGMVLVPKDRPCIRGRTVELDRMGLKQLTPAKQSANPTLKDVIVDMCIVHLFAASCPLGSRNGLPGDKRGRLTHKVAVLCVNMHLGFLDT